MESLLTIFIGGGQMNLYRFNSGTNIGDKSRFFIENVFEELDAPGEFYFNKETRELFVCPYKVIFHSERQGVILTFSQKDDLDTATLVTPIVDNLLHFKGHPRPWNTNDARMWIQHVHFKDLTFTETAPTYLEVYDVPSNGDWTIHRGGTLLFETARHMSVSEWYAEKKYFLFWKSPEIHRLISVVSLTKWAAMQCSLTARTST
jgi:hypothetical protein